MQKIIGSRIENAIELGIEPVTGVAKKTAPGTRFLERHVVVPRTSVSRSI
jgi:hypothetical protein